jgi:hypothetical protein
MSCAHVVRRDVTVHGPGSRGPERLTRSGVPFRGRHVAGAVIQSIERSNGSYLQMLSGRVVEWHIE